MLMVISPAKTLDFTSKLMTQEFTLPRLLNDSNELIQLCRQLSPANISQLMKISPNLGQLNYDRFQTWQLDFNLQNARQAILAFSGDVYAGLHVADFSAQDFQFAQQHLRILSGLYGVLRPLDLIQAYRLEMGIRLNNKQGSNLYQFWGDKLTTQLNSDLTSKNTNSIINLASDEYFTSINTKKLTATVIKPIFLDEKNDNYKIISFYAKKARGLMSRFIIKNKIDNNNDLKTFNLHGYQFDAQRSDDTQWFFKRSAAQAVRASELERN